MPNGFETLLALRGITQKNGRPHKPTTLGKIERFWQILKRHLAAHPAETIDDLQSTLSTHPRRPRPRRIHSQPRPQLPTKKQLNLRGRGFNRSRYPEKSHVAAGGI